MAQKKRNRRRSEKSRNGCARRRTFESLEPRVVLAAQPIISEFLASNDSTLKDAFGDDPDWIEIFNAGDESVDLQGYRLTDSLDVPSKWSFSESTVLEPGGYLIVFASGRDTRDADGDWHTNFKLSAQGEALAFLSPQGAILSQYGTASEPYPVQFTDVSYGLGQAQLVSPQSAAEYLVPRNGELGDTWTSTDFDAQSAGFDVGRAAIGFERSPTSRTSFENWIETELPTSAASVYMRTEFALNGPALGLSLNLRYDDGLVVWLNGTEVFRSQETRPAWNGTSDSTRPDSVVLQGFDLDLSAHLDALRVGTNVLAFHLVNQSSTNNDLLLVPELSATLTTGAAGYLQEPTPAANNSSIITLGPAIRDVTLRTERPTPDQPLIVTARVQPSARGVAAGSVQLHYRVMYDPPQDLMMRDDGRGSDESAGDGVYTARIPGGIAEHGQMVRWYVTAADLDGRDSRAPAFEDRRDSAEFFGTVVPDPTASRDLPVIHWFVRSPSAARTRTGTRASLFMNGEFYDNVQVDLHGQSTATFVKTSYDFDANQSDKFLVSDEFERVSDFNLITNYGDQTKLRNSLGYGAHASAGGFAHFSFPVSVHQNGEFFGLYDLIEQGDTEFLERVNLDPDGALYKINNGLNSTTNEVEKLSRKYEGREDLSELIDAARMSNPAGLIWDYDNIDLADMINYLAVQSLIGNHDFGHKNMYWYHDTKGTQLWSIIPWDIDLSFGHHWNRNDGYFDDRLITTGGLRAGSNRLLQRVYTDDRLRAMYYRRIRTLMDEQLGPRNSPVAESQLVQRATELEALIADEAIRDYIKWGIHRNFSHRPVQAFEQLRDVYFPRRRQYLERVSAIPDAHDSMPQLSVTEINLEQESERSDQQYIRIDNAESYAVDISGYSIRGVTDHTFKAGTVIPANSRLYLVANPTAFKARRSGPRGGRKLQFQANASGVIDQTFGELILANRAGEVLDQQSFGTPPLLRGDTNLDGAVDARDIDTLRAAIHQMSEDARFDLDDNQQVNEEDFELLVRDILKTRPGDANLDGVTDFDDFLIVATNFGKPDRGWAQGNFNLDELVSFTDFLLLAVAFERD